MMLAASLGKSVLGHLAPGEQLHGAVMAQAAGSNRQLPARALGGAAADILPQALQRAYAAR